MDTIYENIELDDKQLKFRSIQYSNDKQNNNAFALTIE